MPIEHDSLGYRLDFKGNLDAFMRGTWTSPWFDTRSAGFTAAWSSYLASQTTPDDSTIAYEFRTATESDKSDATAWTSTINTLTGRYIQVKATLTKPDESDAPTITELVLTPTSVGKGLLLEPSSTNLVTYSEQFDNGGWGKNNVTIVSNAAIAPNGTMTADKVLVDAEASGVTRGIARSLIGTGTGNAAFSVYAKAGTLSWLYLNLSYLGATAWFDLENGVTSNVGAEIKASIEHVGGGWYRCSIYEASVTTANLAMQMVNGAGATTAWVSDGTEYLYLWGAQYEQTVPYPTSYIKTEAATVTRAADLAHVEAALIKPSAGSILARAYFSGDKLSLTSLGTYALFDTEQAGSGRTDRLYLYRAAGYFLFSIINEAGSTANIIGTLTSAITDGWHWVAVKWDANEASVWFDGVKLASSTAAGLPERFGPNLGVARSYLAANLAWNDLISDFVILHRALPDWQMALWTTLGAAPYDNPTYKLAFESNLNIVVEGRWTSRWRPSRKSPTLKSAVAVVTQPDDTSYHLEHRVAEIGFDDPADKALIFSRGSDARDPVTLALTTTKSHPRYVEIAGTVGLMVEETTTNLALYSTDFSNAWWTPSAVTITPNAAIAPDGTSTATKLTGTAATSAHFLQKALGPFTVGQPETVSIYAKAAELSWMWISFGGATVAYFNLTGDGVLGTASGGTSAIEALGDGWYRCSFSQAVAVNVNFAVGLASGNNGSSFLGTVTDGVYLWGAQAELKAFPTSYVPTSGETATRSIEVAKIFSSQLARGAEGKIRCRFYSDRAPGTTEQAILDLAGTGVNGALLQVRTNGSVRWNVGNGAALQQVSTDAGIVTQGSWTTVEVTWGPAGISISANGGTPVTSAIVAAVTLPTWSYLGSQSGTTNPLDGAVAWLAVDLNTSPTNSQYSSATPPTDTHLLYDFTQQTLIPQLGHDLSSEWTDDITTLPESDYIQHRFRLYSNDSEEVPEVTKLTVTPI